MTKVTRNRRFREAIVDILGSEGPKFTAELYPKIESLLPEFCDDDVRDFSGGTDRGPAWKHAVRAAQEALKSKNILSREDDGRWRVTQAALSQSDPAIHTDVRR